MSDTKPMPKGDNPLLSGSAPMAFVMPLMICFGMVFPASRRCCFVNGTVEQSCGFNFWWGRSPG